MTSTDTPELHEQIRRALAEADHFTYSSLEPWDYQRHIAAALRAVAEHCDQAGGAYASRALNDHAAGAFALAEDFLRAADKAEYVATPCDIPPCDTDGTGEPCATHERLMAHAEGEHELCDHTPAATDGTGA